MFENNYSPLLVHKCVFHLFHESLFEFSLRLEFLLKAPRVHLQHGMLLLQVIELKTPPQHNKQHSLSGLREQKVSLFTVFS